MNASLHTEYLDLIPASRQILESDLNDRTELAWHLNAQIPEAWPPPLMDKDVLREFIWMKSMRDGPLFAVWYWVLDAQETTGRTLVGNGGVVQAEGRKDAVVLGYSVLDGFRNRGYATEAVRALIPEIFCLPGVETIIATTSPDLAASIRVLEKCGFLRSDSPAAGTGAEEGTVCYARERE